MPGPEWIPRTGMRTGGCEPAWSGGRSPGTWRPPHPCSPWRGVVRHRSRRDAILTTDLPTDAAPPAKTQTAPDCCRLTHPFLGSITRRAGHDSVRPAHRPAGAGKVVARGQGAGVVRAQHPFGVHCQRLTDRDRLPRAVSQFIQVITLPQPEAQQHPGQLITALGREPTSTQLPHRESRLMGGSRSLALSGCSCA
jgi:hypothetical protein